MVVGSFDMNLVGTDSKGAKTKEPFSIMITNTVPSVVGAIPDETRYNDTTINLTYDSTLFFTDPDVDNLIQSFTYSVTGVPLFLTESWSGNILTLSGSPSAADAGSYQMSLKAYDGYSFGTELFNITIEANYPPTATNVVDISAKELGISIINLSSFAISDPESDLFSTNLFFANGTSHTEVSWMHYNTGDYDLTIVSPTTTASAIPLELIVDDSINPPVIFSFNLNIDYKPKISSSVTRRSGQFIATQDSNFVINGGLFYDEDVSLTYALSKFTFIPLTYLV